MSYQGHAGEGGLQNHSIGDTYPFTVFGKGDPTAYGVLNCATGAETAAVFTCAGALDLAEAFKRGTLADLSDFAAQLRYLDRLHNFCAWNRVFAAAEEVPAECSAIDTGSDQ